MSGTLSRRATALALVAAFAATACGSSDDDAKPSSPAGGASTR
ncbi:hypothetical protein [Streptomyces sp. 8N616]